MCVVISFVNSNDQLADIFTKSLRGPRVKYIYNKLGAYNIYAAPAWGGVLDSVQLFQLFTFPFLSLLYYASH